MQALTTNLQYYGNEAKQYVLGAIIAINKQRGNPDSFHKAAQVAYSTMQLYIAYNPAASYLNKLVTLLQASNMHYFFNFLKIPRPLFYPVDANSIDEKQVYNELPDVETQCSKQKACIKAQLKEMSDNNEAFSSVDEFKSQLNKKLAAKNIGLGVDELKEAKIRPRSTLMEQMIGWTWIVTDLSCAALFLQAWNVINTAKWADRIGQYSAFKCVRTNSLETAVSGLATLGYGLSFIEVWRKLRDQPLNTSERINLTHDKYYALTEIVNNGASMIHASGYMPINRTYLNLFTLAAKGFGLWCNVNRAERLYFEKRTLPTA